MAFLSNDKEKREDAINPEEYEQIRLEASEFLKGSNNPNYGNHALAGENNPYYRKKHDETTLKKIRERIKGKMIGEKNSMFGKKQSDEARAKMRESSKKRWAKPEEREKAKKAQAERTIIYKKVVQFSSDGTIIGIWSSAKEIAKQLNYNRKSLVCCLSKTHRYKGFTWRYLDEIKAEYFQSLLKRYSQELKEEDKK